MSDDGFSDGFEEPTMEIQIKTLLGTTFDMKVSSTDTIGDIKKKIYRIEGIPIYHQNLIYRSRELKDTIHLGDAGIKHGSILTLVAAMRGGPISTRRFSVTCEHHIMLKELKELLENTKDEITPGSKVSVLVFKEGDVINLLRVIENEDGSYSPYSEKPISPPSKPARRESRTGIFERLVEDSEMSTKIANLKKKMEYVNLRKQGNGIKTATKDSCPLGEASGFSGSKNSSLSYKLLSQCGNDLVDGVDLKIYEKNFEEENEEEIALKDKHRSKLHKLPRTKPKSLFSESKGAYSHTKQSYARIHKKSREMCTPKEREEHTSDNLLPKIEVSSGTSEQFTVLKDDHYNDSLPVTSGNRIHLTRLVLSETTERPKSTPDSIELEETGQDLWEIHEPASERLKHSATCKIGLMKRRTSYEGRESPPKGEISNYSCKNSNFEVCSSNFYHMPQLVPSPPQFGPQEQGLCDYYFAKPDRSPLYGRTSTEEASREELKTTEVENEKFSFLTECSSIQRLKNESVECDNFFSLNDQSIDELYGYYNLGCSAETAVDKTVDVTKINRKPLELPPLVKKKARCNECNKRLNITNIYDCRCGKIFCSQHRYSEVHRCTYDYKLEGRRILKQQNPLVTAEKVAKI